MNNEEQELIAVLDAWAAAMVANDPAAIAGPMADDWVIVSDRGISTKERFMSFVESGELTHSAFETRGEPRIRIYGDTAVVSVRVVNTAHFGGQQFDADEWTSDVFRRIDGRWLCVLSHITPIDKQFLAERGEQS
jgi:ketosteroid isomerase-like protein